MRFSIGGDGGLGILDGTPTSVKIACDGAATTDPVETTTTANSGLTFTGGQYTYVWQTQKSWRGTCRRFTLKLVDGTTTSADFKFK